MIIITHEGPATAAVTMTTTTTPPTILEQTSERSAWSFLAFLTLLNLINFVDRQLITSLQIPLRQDEGLRLTNVQNQLLAGYAFSIVYSCAGLVLGNLADRVHRPRLVALGLLVWSAMTAASGLARNFWQLAAARVFVAVGESSLTPAAVAMIGDVFPSRRRSLASGLYYLGIPLGAGLSLIVANLLCQVPWIGWRGCFLSLGVIGLGMVVVLLFVKDPPRGAMDRIHVISSHQPVRAPVREVVRAFRAVPALGLTMLGAFLVNISVGTTWLDPSWLFEERGFTRAGSPIFLGTALIIGGSAGNVLGGWLGDRLRRRWKGGRLLALIVIQLAILPFMIAYRFLPGQQRVGLAVCCCVGSIMITFMYGPVLATIQELAPVRLRATMVAILLIGLNIVGASLGSVIAAALVKPFHSYTWAIFVTAQAALIAIPLFLLAFRRYESDLASLALLQEDS
jgi:MFS family permease